MSRFSRISALLYGFIAIILMAGCSTTPTKPETPVDNTVLTIPSNGTATLNDSLVLQLNSGSAVTVTASNGTPYIMQLLYPGTDSAIISLEDQNGSVTYFKKTGGTLSTVWTAFQQKQQGRIFLIAADPANAITITVSNNSIALASIGLPAFQPGVIVPSDPAARGSLVDSLFTVLIQRTQSLDGIGSYDALISVDFMSLRDAFDAVIATESDNPKANVGYMVSALLSLNTNQSVEKMVDSLDKYYSDYYSVNSGVTVNLMKTSFRAEGVIGLGKSMAVRSPEIALAQTQKPSFPKFITMSYIQGIAENDVVPVLGKIIAAAERLEARSEMSIPVAVDGGNGYDTFELDKGEIYMFEAYTRLLRAYLGMFCAYDMNLYAPGTQDYSWYDTMLSSASTGFRSTVYSLSNDTLYQAYTYNNADYMVYMAKMYKYNFSRPSFLTIRKSNHAQIKTDLLAVTQKVKAGISYIRSEADQQDNDILRMSYINDADQTLVDYKTRLLNSGISPALANRFATPEAIADFVNELLTQPYTFDQTIDSIHVQIKVNFASIFDDPVQDLRTLLPKYQWTSENMWVVRQQTYSSSYYTMSSYFYVYDSENPQVNIPQSMFDSISTDPYSYGYKVYYLKTPIAYRASVDSSAYLDPLRLLDETGKALDGPAIDSLVKAKTFFPVFNDYTFHGLFPDMTRQKWIALIYQN